MPWFLYQRGGWQIAVDATSKQDADKHIAHNAPGAVFQGQFTPSTSYSVATAMTTAKRQEEISARVRSTAADY